MILSPNRRTYGIAKPMTVLIRSNCSGTAVAIAAAAIPDAKRHTVPSDPRFLPVAMACSSCSCRRTSIQKLYNPNKEPNISPAKTVFHSVNIQPRTNNASKKKRALRCLLWISCNDCCILVDSPVSYFNFWF